MNRDLHPELGPRRRVASIEACLECVRVSHPAAYMEGSTGAERSFWVEGNLVAHAWPVRRSGGDDMWLRAANPPRTGSKRAMGEGPRMRACDATLDVLLRTQNPSIMYGDEWLAHHVAEHLGWTHEGPRTTQRLLRAHSQTPGRLVKSYVAMPGDCCARGQAVLCFELPEPERSTLMANLKNGT